MDKELAMVWIAEMTMQLIVKLDDTTKKNTEDCQSRTSKFKYAMQ
ncbi:hypothetical protein [Hafnia alvei]|nr:hypothetical protein [Hafnia alvei]